MVRMFKDAINQAIKVLGMILIVDEKLKVLQRLQNWMGEFFAQQERTIRRNEF